MAILGESFDDYVREQIKTRQNKLALGASHDNDFLKYTHSRTSFLRLTSGINVTDSKIIQNLDLSGAGVTLVPGSGLADYMVISNADFGGFGLTKGLGGTNPSYGFLTNTNYGYSPPPGILSADVRSLNRGSLREATVNLICHNLNQFQVIDTLFLKLRYSFLLEWGHTTYFDNKGELVTPANVKNLSKDFLGWKKDQYALLDKIETTRSDSNGNYDAFFGVIKNFSWELLPNGSYNITIVGISQGDVIESLKLNSNVTPDTTTEGTDTNSKYKTSTLTRILGEIKKQSAPINMIDGYQNGKSYWLASGKIADSLSLKTNFLKPDDNQNATKANSSLATGEAGYLLFYDLYPNSPDGNEYWPYYIKLGALLRIIEAFLLTYDKEKSNAPSFKINYAFDDSDNRCLTIPNHIAIDPRICVIPLKFDAKKLAASVGDNDKIVNTFTANFNNGKHAPSLQPSSDTRTSNITNDEIQSKGHTLPPNPTGTPQVVPYYLTGNIIELEQSGTSLASPITITIDDPIGFSKGIAGLDNLFQSSVDALQGGSAGISGTGPGDTGTSINDINQNIIEKYNPTVVNSSFQAVLSGSSRDALLQQSAFPGQNFSGAFLGTDISNPNNKYFILRTTGVNEYTAYLDLTTNNPVSPVGGTVPSNSTSTGPIYTNLKKVVSERVYYAKGSTAPLSDALATGGILKFLDEGFVTAGNNLVGNTMHMYISIDHAVDLLNNNIDESGNISVYNFLTQLMKDVQRSLGNINDFEVICNDTNNTYTIIDNALIPHISKPKLDDIAKFNVNVLQNSNNNGNGGSFVTNFNLKTELFARVANAIAIGSQANGTTLQSNSSTFSYINEGIQDRILTTKLNANQLDADDVFEKKYKKAYDKFANFVLKYLGIKDGKNNGSTLTPEDIQEANSSLVDLFNYDLGIYSKTEFTGTGFIPLNLQLTMDGLSGIKIYQVFNINEELLPLMYKNKIQFIIKGVNHRISDKGWETNIETLSIPRKDTSGNPQPGRLNVQTLSGGSRSTSTAPPGSTNADLLRAELKLSKYGGKYTENGKELSSSGNDILPGALEAAKKFLEDLNTTHPEYKIKFTAGNDTFHSGKDSPHNQGKAFDIVITGVQSRITPAKYDENDVLIAPAKANPSLYTSEEKQKINNIIEILKKYFKVLDEYIEPSKYATGGHIHFNI